MDARPAIGENARLLGSGGHAQGPLSSCGRPGKELEGDVAAAQTQMCKEPRTVPLMTFLTPSPGPAPPGGDFLKIHSMSTHSAVFPVSGVVTPTRRSADTTSPFASFRGRIGHADAPHTSSATNTSGRARIPLENPKSALRQAAPATTSATLSHPSAHGRTPVGSVGKTSLLGTDIQYTGLPRW